MARVHGTTDGHPPGSLPGQPVDQTCSAESEAGTLPPMARKLWTVDELEKLSREEQQAIFDESIVTDLSKVPHEFLAAVRVDAERLIASREPQHTD